ncbi:uncharacterized protein LOC132633839 [Lycium barbarum]|uniref:uncharacterized protein LOC132633839 n=1 Tax=Lycium barbarum TaxID=112863 RepID=UPI00293F779E|nr:uncharacterized protein LOC132633839 [Lycium barbarum]
MTPTLEEITGFMGMGSKLQGSDLRNKRPIVPKRVDGTKFLNYLKINKMEEASLESGWVSLEFLYERYGQEDGFEKCLGQLNNKGEIETWKIHRRFAFMVAFLGCIVFPERDKQIDIRLAGVVQALTTMDNLTLIPMILGDIFRALTKCKEGAIYFEGCNILLQIWFLEHFYRHHFAPKFNADWVNYMTEHEERVEKCDLPIGIKACEEKLSKLTADKIIWNYHWFPAHEVICMSSHHPFLVLIGLRGVQPYAPLRVMQ